MSDYIKRHLPLTVDDDGRIFGDGGTYIGRVSGLDLGPAEQEAIAAEIVRRVNLHDALLAALKSMLAEFHDIPGMVHDERAAVEKALAILAKVDQKEGR
jgi:hypothetical protein